MTDQADIISVGVDVDDEGFNRLNTDIDAVRAKIGSLTQGIELNTEAAVEYVSALNQISSALGGQGKSNENTAQSVKALSDEVDQLTRNYQQLGQAVQQTDTELSTSVTVQEQLADTGGGAGGGGQIGSLFGIAHGVRAASGLGRLAGLGSEGTAAFTGTADVLYLVQGFRQLQTVIGPVSEAVAGLGVPIEVLGATAGLAVAALGLLVYTMGKFNEIIQEGTKAVEDASDKQEKFYKFIATATTQDVNQRLTSEQGDQAANQRAQQNIINQLLPILRGQGLTDQSIQQILANPAAGKGALSTFDITTPAASALLDQLAKLQKEGSDTATDIAALNKALTDGTVAANDAAAAQKTITDRRIQDVQNQVRFETEAQQLIKSGSVDQVQAKLDANAREYQANLDSIAILKATGDTTKETTDKIQQFENANQALALETATLIQDGVIPAIQAREEEKALEKEITQDFKNAAAAQDAYAKAVQSADDALQKQISSATYREGIAERATQPGSLEDTYARTRIREDEARKEISLDQQTADKISDIHLKEAQKEVDIARQFNQQLTDDQIKVNQDNQKLQVDNQRQQREDLITHEQRLQDIRQQNQDKEFEDILNRDFTALFKDRRSVSQAEDRENTTYQRQEDKLARHLQDQEQDLESHYAQEIAQQQRNEQRKIQEAQIAAANEANQTRVNEERKRAELRTQEQNQLTDLTNSEVQKRALLRQGLNDEITLYRQQRDERIQLAKQERDNIVTASLGAAFGINQLTNAISGLGDQLRTNLGIGGSGSPPIFNIFAQQAQGVGNQVTNILHGLFGTG